MRGLGYRILVASDTDRVTTLLFDPDGPTLKVTSEIKVGTRPTWLAVHPNDPSLVFTGLEQDDGVIVALKYDGSGQGTIVGQISSGGADPASLLATADTLFVGNYSSGTILAAPLSTSPPYFLDNSPADGPPRSKLQLSGSGPNTARQQSSHPHQVVVIPGRAELLVPDLGADRTWRITYDDRRGELSVQGTVSYAPGSGPRHVVFHEDILYTLNELTSTLTAHRLPPLPALPSLLSTTQSFYLTPGQGPVLGDRLAAELLLAPALTEDSDARSDNGPSSSSAPPLLYATNRNDPSRDGDRLTIFSLEDPAAPKLVEEVHTGLQHLRGAAIGGEDGRWVILGGTRGGGVRVYERVLGGRSVKEIAALPDVEGPTAFLWLQTASATVA